MPDLGSLPGVRRATERVREESESFSLGAVTIDEALGGGLALAALHEVLACEVGDAAAAAGFTLALAMRATEGELLWVRHEMAALETGQLYAPGLADLGLDPGRVTLVTARDPLDVLRAADDAVRTGAFGAVLIELWGRIAALDLTATRRLAMGAADAGVTALLLRAATPSEPSAAATRWRIAAAPSVALETGAPGHPAFEAELLRHRGGVHPHLWRMEWNREARVFRDPAPLFGSVVPVPARRPTQAEAEIVVWRHAS